MTFLLILALLFNAVYAVLLNGYRISWKKLCIKSTSYIPFEVVPLISLIIPIRDELKNLKQLILCLQQLDFPDEKLEIIFINDHSTDGSDEFIQQQFPKALCLSLQDEVGKKAALKMGILQAKGEWIVTTDADVYFERDWLFRLMQHSLEIDPVMICGVVIIEVKDEKWLSGFQSMEFSVLQASGAAALEKGNVLLNSGANLAFRKDAWEKVNGYNDNFHISSGDDTFLMIAMHKAFPGRIVSNPLAPVRTIAGNSLMELLQQRIRWASKSRYYDNLYIKKTGFILILSAISIFLILILAFFFHGDQNRLAAFVLWTIFLARGISEWRLLNNFSSFYNLRFSIGDKLRMTLLYPFFLIFLLLEMPFSEVRWKGRKLN